MIVDAPPEKRAQMSALIINPVCRFFPPASLASSLTPDMDRGILTMKSKKSSTKYKRNATKRDFS
jgi:hypothetical protein